MKTTYINNERVIELDGCLYRYCDQSSAAVLSLEWAAKMLAQPDCIFPNGRSSHELANIEADKAHDELLNHRLFQVFA